MHEQEFRLLGEIEEEHWWFVGMRLILAALLRGRAGSTARALESVMTAAGLELERTTYTHFFVFPVAALWRVRRPFGVSVACVGRRAAGVASPSALW